MVGSLVVDADMMSQEAATSSPVSTQRRIVQETTDAVEHIGEDVKRSVNVQKRQTEMYGTLIVDTGTVESHNNDNSTSPPSPGTGDDSGSSRRNKWSDPMDPVSRCSPK